MTNNLVSAFEFRIFLSVCLCSFKGSWGGGGVLSLKLCSHFCITAGENSGYCMLQHCVYESESEPVRACGLQQKMVVVSCVEY